MKKWGTWYKCPGMGMLLAVLVSGCMNVDYVGQTFPALPAGTPVIIYSPEAPMPQGIYRSIGRVTISAPQRSTSDDIRAELTDLALEHGAEAVNVVEFKRVQVGVESYGSAGQPTWNNDDRNAGGGYIYSNSFGQRASIPGNTHPVFELRVKALLMVTNERFAEMQALYQKEHAQFEVEKTLAPEQELTADEALDKTVDNAVLPPASEIKTAPEKQDAPAPVNIDLSDDRRQPVAL